MEASAPVVVISGVPYTRDQFVAKDVKYQTLRSWLSKEANLSVREIKDMQERADELAKADPDANMTSKLRGLVWDYGLRQISQASPPANAAPPPIAVDPPANAAHVSFPTRAEMAMRKAEADVAQSVGVSVGMLAASSPRAAPRAPRTNLYAPREPVRARTPASPPPLPTPDDDADLDLPMTEAEVLAPAPRGPSAEAVAILFERATGIDPPVRLTKKRMVAHLARIGRLPTAMEAASAAVAAEAVALRRLQVRGATPFARARAATPGP